MSSECVDNSWNEIDCDAGFNHITERTFGQARANKLNPLMYGEKNKNCTGSSLSQPMGRFNAGEPGH